MAVQGESWTSLKGGAGAPVEAGAAVPLILPEIPPPEAPRVARAGPCAGIFDAGAGGRERYAPAAFSNPAISASVVHHEHINRAESVSSSGPSSDWSKGQR